MRYKIIPAYLSHYINFLVTEYQYIDIFLQDYEVALSLGHLASLYTYDMNMFEEAEQLYLRSISIGKLVDNVACTTIIPLAL